MRAPTIFTGPTRAREHTRSCSTQKNPPLQRLARPAALNAAAAGRRGPPGPPPAHSAGRAAPPLAAAVSMCLLRQILEVALLGLQGSLVLLGDALGLLDRVDRDLLLDL